MATSAQRKQGSDVRHEGMRIGGEKVVRDRVIEVFNPFTEQVIATVPKATLDDIKRAFAIAKGYKAKLTRYERANILNRAAELMRARTDELSDLITSECGICKKDSLYEVGRACDVMNFAAGQTLIDDGQVFSCDLTPHGKKRRVYTQRDPLLGAISAITPFNHPLNQVAHKVAPSIATNNRMVLKPTEKTPLSAIVLADILYEAGLPPEMYQVVTGDPQEIADEMLTNPDVDLITFTGGVPIGKYIASKAGYKRMVLELGGNDPLIVMEDADIDEAASLAVAGSYKNSGQRCTAVKRMLVHEKVADQFVELVVAKTKAWACGDPMDGKVDMGTVIDEPAAKSFEDKVNEAVKAGAKLLVGNIRRGALYSPICRSSNTKPSGRCRLSSASRTSTTPSAFRIPPRTGCLRVCAPTVSITSRASCPSCMSARSTCARCRVTASSSRRSAASRIRASATRKACRKQ